MVDVVITGHGGRGAGTATGTYVVPKGVTVYFFVPDHSVLYEGASDLIMDALCTSHPKTMAVCKLAKSEYVFKQFSTVPNYVCYGTTDFRDPSGVYYVGRSRRKGPFAPIPDGTTARLSDIIGGAGSGGAIGNRVFWLCCRAAPDNSNLIDDDADISTGKLRYGRGGRRETDYGAIEVGSALGISPSEVRRTGQWR